MARFHFSIPSFEKALRISDDIFGLVVDLIDAEIAERQRIKLIVSELFMNAYVHGNHADPEKPIEVTMEFDRDFVVVQVKDFGKGLTRKRYDELILSNDDFESSSGRGMRIIGRLCDRVEFFKDENGKFCIKAVKKIKTVPIPVIE